MNQKWWSIDSDEDSINGKFIELQIGSSCELDNDDKAVISRGNPMNNKCSRKSNSKSKAETSKYVLHLVKNKDNNSDLGYSSVSPTTELSLHNCMSQYPVVSLPSSHKQHCKNAIREILLKKLRNKDSNEISGKFYLEFEDTNLIKSCRIGKVSIVQDAINHLTKYRQLALIDHQNYARETALSVAICHNREELIILLLKYKADPTIPLTMENNVLHLAAAMTNDPERKALKYLIDAIELYQHEFLIPAITNHNIFNIDVLQTLQSYQQKLHNDSFEFHRLQSHINRIQYIINAFYLS